MEIIDQGNGELFTNPDPEITREFTQQKSRKMTNKVMDLKSAIATYVHGGEYLGIGGFGANRLQHVMRLSGKAEKTWGLQGIHLPMTCKY